MEFYSSIAELYDYIFPLNQDQVDFTERELRSWDSPSGAAGPCSPDTPRILDTGCGTGNLSIALASRGHAVIGIDVDAEMIGRAKEKAGADARFLRMDMTKIGDEFGPKAFDAVLCFGNTLVHLTDPVAIRGFLEAASRVLVPGGLLLLQIINYDRILGRNIEGLSTIENEHVRFERNYSVDPDTGLVLFHTILTGKKSGWVFENTIPLYPLRERQLCSFIEDAGFTDIKLFGSFSRAPFSHETVPLIVSARNN